MKRARPSTIVKPPAAVRRAKLDNIALVPASLLPFKDTYQPLANKLPKGQYSYLSEHETSADQGNPCQSRSVLALSGTRCDDAHRISDRSLKLDNDVIVSTCI